MKKLIAYFRQEEWSPYVSGIVLGIIAVLSLLLAHHPVGASGSFENVAGLIGKAIAPRVFDNIYFNFIMPPGISWQVVLMLGVFLGGTLGALSAGTWKLRKLSDEQWKSAIGRNWKKRWLFVFLGAIIIEYGAGIAGGCTSGLAIAGGLELAPAAFLFMAGMFAAGIPTAMIVYRKKW